jgi:fatty acid desaturase
MTTWVDVLRRDVLPVLAAWLVWVVLLASFRRRRRHGRHAPANPSPPAGRAAFVALSSMAVGGYVLFLAIVVVFSFVLGDESGTLVVQALREGSALAFLIVVPAFLLLSWVEERWRRSARLRGGRDRQ